MFIWLILTLNLLKLQEEEGTAPVVVFGWLDLDWTAQAICVFWSVLRCFLGGCCWCSLPFWRLSVAVLRSVVLWVNHPPRSQQRNRARYRQDVWLLMDVETRFHSAVYNSRLRKNTLWKVLPSDVSLWARELELPSLKEGHETGREPLILMHLESPEDGGEKRGAMERGMETDRQTDEAWKRKPEKERRPVLCWSVLGGREGGDVSGMTAASHQIVKVGG